MAQALVLSLALNGNAVQKFETCHPESRNEMKDLLELMEIPSAQNRRHHYDWNHSLKLNDV